MDMHPWIFMFYEYQLNGIAWISLLGYQCKYPHLYEELETNIRKSWISIWITVDLWKSMYGYAIDSQTRERSLFLEMENQTVIFYLNRVKI